MNGQRRLQKLERVETVARREIVAAMRRARGDVAEKIAKAGRDKGIVTSERRRRAAFSAIGGYYDRLEREITAIIEDTAYGAARMFHEEAVEDIRAARGRVAQAVVLFDRRRVDAIWAVVAPENGQNLAAVFTKKMEQEEIRNLRTALVETWRIGDLEGLTLQERHRELQKRWDQLAGNTLADRFVDRAGRKWKNADYLNMLTRTTCARVARDTYFDVLIKAGDDLAIIENVDGDACEVCAEWDGKVISITGRTAGYPSYAKAIAVGWGHPNCRCTAERWEEEA